MHYTHHLRSLTLDQAVAKALELEVTYHPIRGILCYGHHAQAIVGGDSLFAPSLRWQDAGPIIAEHRITIQPTNTAYIRSEMSWQAISKNREHSAHGATPLIAAMRCFCVQTFGKTVDLPIVRTFKPL
jgi:hypothetical protein